MPETVPAPRIRWFAVTEGQRIPATSTMRGTWGWDATCSCGWDTRTGGATRSYVREEVRLHKLLDH
jgi:hypothetical protein